MAPYDLTRCPQSARIQYWSNPDITYNGISMGTETYENNARVLNETRGTVSGFRHRPLSVYINGPSYLPFLETGWYTVYVSGGDHSASETYSWYRKDDGSSTWYYKGYNNPHAEKMIITNFNLKVDVTKGAMQGSYIRYVQSDRPLPKDVADIPITYDLYQNHPNPFNPATTIRYELPEASRVALTIYNIMGREVNTWNLLEPPGYRQVVWDGRDGNGRPVPTGIYMYRIVATSIEGSERFAATRKMVLIK